jgi:hypothetical protein
MIQKIDGGVWVCFRTLQAQNLVSGSISKPLERGATPVRSLPLVTYSRKARYRQKRNSFYAKTSSGSD